MKKAGEEAEVETDCINGVVGFIIKYSCFYLFSQEKSYSYTFRLISILLIICTFPFSLFVTVKMVQVATQNINKLSFINFLNPPRW